MANIIIDSATGKPINSSQIASLKNDGILIEGAEIGNFTYVPGKQMTYTPAYGKVSLRGPDKQLPYGHRPGDLDNNRQELLERTVYNFGIDSITARYTAPKPVSGFISQPIDIGPCSYVTLSVKTAAKLSGRMEFSIIDGSSEVPILPEEMGKKIVHEKLFPNMPTRFSIDTSVNYVIYKDNTPVQLTYDEVQTMPLDDGEYTITYTTKADYKYFPTSTSIRVKVIVRCPDKKPTPIKAMTIKRFGGEMPWRISD